MTPKDEQDTRDEVIKELQEANRHLLKQNSASHIFFTGILQGIGFFIGSAIIATILVGIFAPYVAQIPLVRHLYEAGLLFRH